MRSKSKPYVRAALLLLLSSCGDEPGAGKVPWSNRRTQVVGTDGVVVSVAAVRTDDCLEYRDTCVPAPVACQDQAADIFVDANSNVLDYLCYPAEATLTVEELEAREGNLEQRENNAVIVLDELDDGIDLQGDVSIDANNVVVYGEQPDLAVIAGNVRLDGNNALIRGVRIQGDLTIDKNNATVALCVIEGDLIIHGNNARLLGCDVFGSVTVTGNNTSLFGNHFAGQLANSGNGLTCRENLTISDANTNLVVDPLELGEALVCD